jgi:hypothetical protein
MSDNLVLLTPPPSISTACSKEILDPDHDALMAAYGGKACILKQEIGAHWCYLIPPTLEILVCWLCLLEAKKCPSDLFPALSYAKSWLDSPENVRYLISQYSTQ